MEPTSLLTYLSQGSSVVLSFVVVGFIFGWLIPKRVYDESHAEVQRLVKKNEELQAELLASVRITGHAVANNRVPRKDG